MDVTALDTGFPDVARDDVGETGRAADVHVAFRDVGDELLQMRGR